MNRYVVKSTLGERSFTREEDATDYQIKILSQLGVRSEVTDTCGIREQCGEKCGAKHGKDCVSYEQAVQGGE